jgi:hypothetical protein
MLTPRLSQDEIARLAILREPQILDALPKSALIMSPSATEDGREITGS